MCRLLDISASGYYAWLERAPSARAVSDAELLEKIRAIHTASRSTYGAPRILHELRETHELHVSRKRVARLMREAGIQGVHRRKRAHTTIRCDDARAAPDLVDRNFEVDRPDRLWSRRYHLRAHVVGLLVPRRRGCVCAGESLDAQPRKDS